MPRLAVNDAEGSPPAEAAPVDAASTDAGPAASGTRVKAAAKRTGVPVWRTGKPDAVLAAAVDAAREAVHSIADPSDVGTHVGARTEGDRVVTHLFECRLSGYPGWQWFAVLTRNSRSKVITVNEVGLLPSDNSVLAPEWVPWAERVRPEDAQPEESAEVSPDSPEPTDSPELSDSSDSASPEDPAAVVEQDSLDSVRHSELAGDSVQGGAEDEDEDQDQDQPDGDADGTD